MTLMPCDSRRTRTLLRLQAGSGLVLLIFVVAHMLNTFAAILGPRWYDAIQRVLQRFYQFPLVEIVGVGLALVIHVVVGVLRVRARRANPARTAAPRSLALRLHRWSAYYLALVVFGHAMATRLPSLLFAAWPGFAGVSFSLAWQPAFFYPYYFLLELCGVYHTLYGARLALAVFGVRVGPRVHARVWLAAMLLVAALTILALLAFGGVTRMNEDPMDNDYARVYQRYLHDTSSR